MRRNNIWAVVALALHDGASAKLLPIFFMHGVGDNYHEFDSVQEWIKTVDSNVTMLSIPIFNDQQSYANLWEQGRVLIEQIREATTMKPDVYKDGYTLLCHSQGALTCRTAVERMDDHRVHTLISMAGPQAGEYGVPKEGFGKKVPWARELAYAFFLTGPEGKLFQRNLSIANFWADPRPRAQIFGKPAIDTCTGNTFLPVFNNDPCRSTQGPGLPKSDAEAARYKRNLLKLKKFLLTASPTDEMIIPAVSGVFEFYNQDASATVPLESTKMWSEDWLGLKALNDTDRLVRLNVPNVCHTCWAHDESVFRQNVLPYLPHAPVDTVLLV